MQGKRTDIPACPHCSARNAWLAMNQWTCHECGQGWLARQGRTPRQTTITGIRIGRDDETYCSGCGAFQCECVALDGDDER